MPNYFQPTNAWEQVADFGRNVADRLTGAYEISARMPLIRAQAREMAARQALLEAQRASEVEQGSMYSAQAGLERARTGQIGTQQEAARKYSASMSDMFKFILENNPAAAGGALAEATKHSALMSDSNLGAVAREQISMLGAVNAQLTDPNRGFVAATGKPAIYAHPTETVPAGASLWAAPTPSRPTDYDPNAGPVPDPGLAAKWMEVGRTPAAARPLNPYVIVDDAMRIAAQYTRDLADPTKTFDDLERKRMLAFIKLAEDYARQAMSGGQLGAPQPVGTRNPDGSIRTTIDGNEVIIREVK